MTKLNAEIKVALIFLAALLFSSCATIINGGNTKIKLNYDNGTIVTIDGNKIQDSIHEVKVKSKNKHTIVMNKEGYKPVTYEIYPMKKPTYLWDFAGGLVSIPFYMNMGHDAMDPGRTGRFFLAMGVMYAVPLAMLAVDKITGASFRSFPKEISFTPVKIPPQNNAKSQYQIGCTDVNVRIKIGEKIGTIYSKKGKQISDVYWENTVNIKAEELEVIVNNGLKDLGFSVPKEFGNKGFMLNAEITGLIINTVISTNIDMNGNVASSYNMTDCKLTTKWTLTDITTNEVIKTQMIESFNLEKFKSLNNALLGAFENSFLTFIVNNPTVYDVVSKKEEFVPVSNFDTISLPLPKLSEQSNIQGYTHSVVTIETEDNGYGSGFLISEDGYILTNYHVVKNNNKVNVTLQSGLSFIGDVVRYDPSIDLALIKLTGKGFKPLELSETENNNVLGSEVYAIGTPADKNFSQTVTKGIISGNRLMDNIGYIQTDVSVSPGSSGGPLLNKNGLVLGIITSKVTGKGVEGISFALPTKYVFEVLKLKYR